MKIIQKSIIVCTISLVLYVCLFLICSFILPDAYSQSYAKGFIRQYRALQNTNENERILIFGGSYVPFSIDSKLLSYLSGRTTYTLGVNAGMGLPYVMDSIMPFIKEKDIVIMPLASFKADYYGMESIFIAIDGNYDLIQKFIEQYPQKIIEDGHIWIVTKLYGTFISGLLEKIRNSYKVAEGTVDAYSISNFDESGNYILKSYECICPESELMKKSFFNGYNLSNDEIEFINKFSNFCHQKDAKFVVTYSPMYEGFFTNTQEQFLEEEVKLEKKINATFISDVESCLYPTNMIYNALAHLNSYGQEAYTKKLYNDLVAHGFL